MKTTNKLNPEKIDEINLTSHGWKSKAEAIHKTLDISNRPKMILKSGMKEICPATDIQLSRFYVL